jgi:acylphosphatase
MSKLMLTEDGRVANLDEMASIRVEATTQGRHGVVARSYDGDSSILFEGTAGEARAKLARITSALRRRPRRHRPGKR